VFDLNKSELTLESTFEILNKNKLYYFDKEHKRKNQNTTKRRYEHPAAAEYMLLQH